MLKKWVLSCAVGLCGVMTSGAESMPDSYYDAVLIDLKAEDGKAANGMVAATPEAVQKFIDAQKLNGSREPTVLHYEVFPESRYNSFIMVDAIPQKWLDYTLEQRRNFTDEANPGEYYMFQTGFFAMRQDFIDVRARISDLENESGDVIASGKTFCLNTDGVDNDGKPFFRTLNVPQGKLQILWMGIKIPDTAKGTYKGKLWISPKNGKEVEISLTFKVDGKVLTDHGFSRDRSLARLHWLNSDAGIDHTVTKAYIPLKRSNSFFSGKQTISFLGREVVIDKTGLPIEFNSAFKGANDQLSDNMSPVLSDAMRFEVFQKNGTALKLDPVSFEMTGEYDDRMDWRSVSECEDLTLTCLGSLSFDGAMTCSFDLQAKKDISIKDIRFTIPFTREKSKYIVGLGLIGGLRPAHYEWKWQIPENLQEAVWIGGVNGGIRCRLIGDDSHDRLVNIYSLYGPLRTPQCWSNFGKGGVTIATTADSHALMTAYTGAHEMLKGENTVLKTELSLTPFKLVDKSSKFDDRYYHPHNYRGFEFPKIFDQVNSEEANLLVCHHSNSEVNPWLNYPLRRENVDLSVQRVKEAHARDLRMKIYYTARELSVHTPEFPALLSMNDEIIFSGPAKDVRTVLHGNGPKKWLTDHLKHNFIPAWPDVIRAGKHKGAQDLTVIVAPQTRYGNFYVASLEYYAKKTNFDGLYIDDCSLNRTIFMRTRRVLEKNAPQAKINIHSCNHWDPRFGMEPCLNLYMPLLAFVDLVWLGEGRSPDFGSQDYWLIESTGIPFGAAGQMLEGGGNPWRGMLFNMTGRSGWGARQNPKFMWRFWDAFDLKSCEMIGFWDERCPVTTDHPDVPVTVYLGKKKAAIALATWQSAETVCNVKIDWSKLGLDPAKCEITIPEIEGGFQKAQSFDPVKPLKIPAKQGFIITITEK